MIKSPTVILSNFTSNLNEEEEKEKELKSISLLPFQISYDGLAPISTYFSTRTRISTSKTLNLTSLPLLESSFRGRQVLSTPINLPKGFKGLIFSTTTPTVSIINSINNNDKSKTTSSNKRVKLNSSDEFSQEKGKGKEIVLPSLTGRRTSPRKKVTVVKYSMDSDEEEEDEEEEGDKEGKKEVEENRMELDEQVLIEIIAPTSPIRSPSPTPSSSSKALSAHPSTSSVFSHIDTPLESQSSSQEESSQKELENDEEEEVKDVQELIPFATFNAIQIWNSDYELDEQEDVFVRSINEWVGIGSKIHSY